MMPEKQTIEQVLFDKGVYIGPTVGISMLPMLKNRRDTIVVQAKTERLKPLDVALYKRGDAYVLHRVLEVKEKGYIIRGDNCYTDEQVPEESVIGVLTEFFRKNKHFYCTDEKYLKYVKRRLKYYKPRRFFVLCKSYVRAGIKKVLRIFRIKK
ncbi:MAG: S24/S26 family peptidase [Clostridia bacterium]|nr:S24/S26 family peptidase [Clostridia bacterium]